MNRRRRRQVQPRPTPARTKATGGFRHKTFIENFDDVQREA
eukprot:CAMPEP_0198648658 /NCGR_PEP_ID=MMETSP1467-20131203/3671_1 /TAXON_ID=1462469 /ORGANISM="unid. sp., Strain CCMP2135" /LENGTH=40 /DNA_ID= /DNA_START= /DNA_END= /DNA_ORIENTATION=